MEFGGVNTLEANLDVGIGCGLADYDVFRRLGAGLLVLIHLDPGKVECLGYVAFEDE